MSKKGERVVASSRKDGITVRKYNTKRIEVDFEFDTPPGQPGGRFRRNAPCATIGQAREWGRRQRENAIAAAWGKKDDAAPRADPTGARDFAFWARRFLEDAESPAKRGGPNRPTTLRSKALVVEVHLIPAFGRRPVDSIKDEDVERYVLGKSRAGLAPGTLRLHGSKLRGILRLAKKKGTGVERALELPEFVIDKPRGEDLPETLSEAQTDALLVAFREAPTWHLALLTLLFREGLRIGEALGLRWADIDFARETILVQRAIAEGEVGRTKGGKPRSIPLHWQAREALERLGPSDGWVFATPRRASSGPRSYRGVLDVIRPRWDAQGFVGDDGEPIGWHTHIGRHSLGRHWATRGWPMRGLQDLLGHVDMKTTQIYAHWSVSATAPLLQQLGRREVSAASARNKIGSEVEK